MMKKNFLFAFAALIAVSSCTSEINEEGFVDKANSISFNAYSNKSRAVSGDVTSDNMIDDNFGVVGYTHDDNKIYLYKGSYAAVEQTWDGDSWEYKNLSDLRFWPNKAMDFYAYFPFSDEATFTASNANDASGKPVTVMTIPNVNCSHDVLFAYVYNQPKTDRVPLTFHHAFAKMKGLQIEMPTDGMLYKSGCQIEVKGVEFINTSTSGNIKVDNAGVASYDVAETNVTLKEDLSSSVVTVNNANTSGALINNGSNAKGYFFATNKDAVNSVKGTDKTMWNGTKGALESGKLSEKEFVCLKLTCKVWNGTNHYYVGSATADTYGVIYIPLTGNSSDPKTVATFDAGKRYTYTIKMKDNVGFTDEGDPILTPILFNVTSVDEWGDVTVTITL